MYNAHNMNFVQQHQNNTLLSFGKISEALQPYENDISLPFAIDKTWAAMNIVRIAHLISIPNSENRFENQMRWYFVAHIRKV